MFLCKMSAIEFYRSPEGATASIRIKSDGTWVLRVCACGDLLFRKAYASHRGAKIAMSRHASRWTRCLI